MEIEEARKKPEIMHFLLHCFGLYVIDTVPAPAVHSSCIAPSKAYFIRQAQNYNSVHLQRFMRAKMTSCLLKLPSIIKCAQKVV